MTITYRGLEIKGQGRGSDNAVDPTSIDGSFCKCHVKLDELCKTAKPIEISIRGDTRVGPAPNFPRNHVSLLAVPLVQPGEYDGSIFAAAATRARATN